MLNKIKAFREILFHMPSLQDKQEKLWLLSEERKSSFWSIWAILSKASASAQEVKTKTVQLENGKKT